MTVYEFELRLRDALEGSKPLEAGERAIISSVAGILKEARKTNKITLHQRGIIVLQSFPRRSGALARDRRRPASK